jgi:hypothetical protein
MLSKAEVQAIIDAAAALKAAKKGKGGAQAAANQNKADQRVSKTNLLMSSRKWLSQS